MVVGKRSVPVLVTFLWVCGCGTGGGTYTDLPDGFGDTVADGLDAPDVPEGPPDLSRRLEPGEVRAGRMVKDIDLIGGRTAKGRIGDYKLYNSKVSFIVQDIGIQSGYKRYGGVPVDADVIRPEGESGRSQLGEMFFALNLRLFEPDEAEVVSDGTDGGRAVVRMSGRDGYFPWLGSFLGDMVPENPLGCELVYEYSLGPDDEALTLEILVVNSTDHALDLSMVAVALIVGDGLKSHYPGPGFDAGAHQGEFPYWAGMGDEVSYGLLALDGPINHAFTMSNVGFGIYPSTKVGPGDELVFTRYLAVTDGGLDRVGEILGAIEPGSPVGNIAGTVDADARALTRGVRVHVLDDEGRHLSAIRIGEAGDLDAALPAGSYRLMAKADGFDPSDEVLVDVVAGQTAQVLLKIPTSTPFHYQVVDGDGNSLPARLTFLREGPQNNLLPAAFGEESHGYGAALVVYSGTGEGDGVVPQGTYEVWATRGTEYERDWTSVTADGADLDLSFVLPHVVDNAGFLASDLHIHSEQSPDASVPVIDRVLTALAAGLEVPVMTDHDTIFDFTDATQAIPGATEWIRMITGSEITTYMYGHFNAWPLTPKPDLINNGGIDWFDTDPGDLFARIRGSEAHPVVIQVNHPRSPSIGGYFSAVGLDIAAGVASGPWQWVDDFDAVEVFNGGCANGDSEELLDWFDMLDRGYRYSIGAASDTHSARRIGMPRTYIRTDHVPSDFDEADMVSSITGQRGFVSCGPFLRFGIGGGSLGDTVTEPGPLQVWIEVQAPSWMTLLDLRVIRNGVVVLELPVEDWPPALGAVRFDSEVALPAEDVDGWYVLEVRGAGSLSPYEAEVPYAVTNPIYVDVDGNGVFDPPKPAYQVP